jgi:hypothetical protein
MRHVLLSGPVTTAAFSMGEAAMATRLVEPARFPDRVPPRRRRAVAGAVDLAMVAGAANQYLHAAARAQEESARGFHWRPKSRQGAVDRGFRLVEYSPCTRARHGVGHDIGVNLAVWAGVGPVLFGGIVLPHPEPGCHPCPLATPRRRPAPLRARFQSPYGLLPTRPQPPPSPVLPAPDRRSSTHPGGFGHRRHGARFTRISTAIHMQRRVRIAVEQ